uniref:Ig-like domain-containing protein n=1 Tax=Limnohabitans sp. TaxID=1907725 RepID=UPI0039BD16FD
LAGATGTVQDGWGFTDTVTNIEEFTGSYYNDTFLGNAADQTFNGSKGNDTMDGGAGYDEVGFNNDDAGVTVRLGGWVGTTGNLPADYTGSARDGWGNIDVFKNIEGVEGSAFNDTITGDANNNRLDGRGGADAIDGGAGVDWVEYNQAMVGISVDLSRGLALDDGQGIGLAAQSAAVEQDTLTNIENVLGGYGNDSIVGSSVANELDGAAGNDTLNGGDGNDTLTGGSGNDSIDGGAGSDTAKFTGLKSDYTITHGVGGSVTVVDKTANRDGTDQLTNIEFLSFSDGTIAQTGLQLGTVSGVNLNLISPVTLANGKTYYIVDLNNDGVITDADPISHVTLDLLFNNGSDRTDTQPTGAVAGVDDARTLIVNGYTLVNPTTTEFIALRSALGNVLPTGWVDSNYATSTLVASNVHHNVSFKSNITYTNLNDTVYPGFFVVQVLSSGDTLAPTVTTFSPADNATGVAVGSNIVLTFSEAVQKGTGSIVISNGTDTRTIAVSDAQITVSGSTVTINPTADLQANSTYWVQLASGAIKDLAGNAYAGISNTTTLNFTTGIQSATAGNDNITGTSGNDTINGLAGNDIISGLAGNDSLTGGLGADTLTGGQGNDSLVLTETPSTFASDVVIFSGGSGNAGTTVRAQSLGLDIITGMELGTNTTAVDRLQFSAADFAIQAGSAIRGSAANTDGNFYIVTAAPRATSVDLNGSNNANSGAIVFVGANSGTAGVNVWYTTNEGAFTSTNSVQIATLVGVNTASLNATDLSFIA